MKELTKEDTRGHRLCPERLEVAVLDWAGTTVDYGSRAPILAILSAFEQAGVPVSEAEARRPMGRAKWDHLHALLTDDRVAARWTETKKKAPTTQDVDAIYNDFLSLQAECLVGASGVIDGCVEAIEQTRQLGIKIGSSTGYSRDQLAAVSRRAKEEGYEPDLMLSADDISPGRPAPWLCVENARRLGATSLTAVVKVDDTPAGVIAGRNAGAWSVGVVHSGNEVGLSHEAFEGLDDVSRRSILHTAEESLKKAGAHFLIDTIAELPAVINRINERLASNDRP